MEQASSLTKNGPQPARSSLIQRLRVPLGFLFGFLFIWFAEPRPIVLLAGIVIALPGLLLRLWASGHLQKHRRLTISGPYRWTRNPLYLGSFLMGLGLCIASGRLPILLLFIALFFLVYHPVMKKEEAELASAYADDYREYRKRVPLFLPLPGRSGLPAEGNFSTRQVILNEEYKAIVGFLLIVAFLITRVNW